MSEVSRPSITRHGRLSRRPPRGQRVINRTRAHPLECVLAVGELCNDMRSKGRDQGEIRHRLAVGSLEEFGAPVRPSDIAGCAAIDFPKAATEMRRVVKADVIGDFSYFPRAVLRFAKHAISAREAVIEKKS